MRTTVACLSIVVQISGQIHFASFGDFGLVNDDLTQVVSVMGEQSPSLDFVALLGDNFYSPNGVESVNDPRWKTLFSDIIAKNSKGPFYAILGNMDYNDKPAKNKHRAQAQIEYSKVDTRWVMPSNFYVEHITKDDVHICLCAIDTDVLDAAQLAWIEETLSSAECSSPNSWRIVIGHRPIWSALKDTETPVNAVLLPIFKRNKVDLYLCGHEHLQAIFSDGDLTQVISGATAFLFGDAPFYKHDNQVWGVSGRKSSGYVDVVATKDALTITIISGMSGHVFNTFTVPKHGRTKDAMFGHIHWHAKEFNKDTYIADFDRAAPVVDNILEHQGSKVDPSIPTSAQDTPVEADTLTSTVVQDKRHAVQKDETSTKRSHREGDSYNGVVPWKKKLASNSVVSPANPISRPTEKKEEVPKRSLASTGANSIEKSSALTKPKQTTFLEQNTKPNVAASTTADPAKPKSNLVLVYPKVLIVLLFGLLA